MEIGERSPVAVSGLDIGILNIIQKRPKGIGVMELQKELDVSHQSLKPRLDHLIKADVIETSEVEKKRTKLLKINPDLAKFVTILTETFE